MNVLVVDDSRAARRALVNMLTEAGAAAVFEADTAAAALETLEGDGQPDRPIDVVLSDYYMLGLSGVDLLRSLRLDGRFADLPFILMSSDHSAERINEAMDAGADEYLIKPFDTEALISKLRLIGLGSPGPVDQGHDQVIAPSAG